MCIVAKRKKNKSCNIEKEEVEQAMLSRGI